MKYNQYLLIASAVIIGLMLLGVMVLPLLFIALPIITLIVLGFIWTSDITVNIEDNNNKEAHYE